jgi:hypothetical protein
MSSHTPRHSLPLLPPIPRDQLHRRELPDCFTDLTVRGICRGLADIECVASVIQKDLSSDIKDAELSQLFGHSVGWAQGMIARYKQEVQAGPRLSPGRIRTKASPYSVLLKAIGEKEAGDR